MPKAIFSSPTCSWGISLSRLKVLHIPPAPVANTRTNVLRSAAFLLATETQDFTAYGDGILGLGFNSFSTVYNTLAKAHGAEVAAQTGNTPMPALLAQQPSLPRTVDIQLSREDELRDITQGTFLIGEHDANFQQVTNAPQLPVVSPGSRWAVVLDAMNINGAPFKFSKSSVPGTPDGKVVALLDTGYSFPPLPPAAVDAIYSSIPGAVRDPSLGFPWVVPCNASLKLSFVLGCVFRILCTSLRPR